MAAFYPKITAFRILKTTEGIENIPGILASAGAIAALLLDSDVSVFVAAIILGHITGRAVNLWGIHAVPGLVKFSVLWSYIAGYGLALIALSAGAYFEYGHWGILATLAGFVVAKFVAGILEFFVVMHRNRRDGSAATSSEINFVSSIRIHATWLGESTDLSDAFYDVETSRKRACFMQFAANWPEVARKFQGSF